MSSTKSPTPHLSCQHDLFNKSYQVPKKTLTISATGRAFVNNDPHSLTYGNISLKHYLEENGETGAFIIRSILEEQDWSGFESKYSATGRAPYSPMAMMGLILCGTSNAVSSLRALKRFSRFNLTAQWVTGGICPDYSVIGDFINRHSEQIQGDFFIALTRSILKKTNSSCGIAAGDGTVIEAACSYYNLLKEEAVLTRRKKAEEELACAPDDPVKQKNLEEAQEVEKILGERVKNAINKGRKSKNVCINPKETDAFVLRNKRARGTTAAYIIGVLANEDRIIVGQDVHPSNEVSMVSKQLDQVTKIAGKAPDSVLLDTGYFCIKVIDEGKKRNTKIYCAEKKGSAYSKNKFVYSSENDSYICPAGNTLTAVIREKNRTRYATEGCGSCPARSECATSIKGRSIHRYPFDEEKEKVVAFMKQDRAKQLYKSRAGLVEPVFSMLRGVQQFNRFKCRGLASVRLEFSIQALAYNINR